MTNLQCMLDYRRRGISMVPQAPGEKKPLIRWKEYRQRLPRRDEIEYWHAMWPDAGVAAVLGPLSGLLVIDVDGPEAQQALIDHLGSVPLAPMALSGSGKPCRYHLYFRHPPVLTGAKATPWHPALEFRGEGGLVVLPPALHASGHRYRWADGQSLDDMKLPELPAPILAALATRARRIHSVRELPVAAHPVEAPVIPGISNATRQFLRGEHTSSRGWNNRLFNAACDLCGNGVVLDNAVQLLLAGARPTSAADETQAQATIASAYSQERVPGRTYQGSTNSPEPVRTWQAGEIIIHEMPHSVRRYLPPRTSFDIQGATS